MCPRNVVDMVSQITDPGSILLAHFETGKALDEENFIAYIQQTNDQGSPVQILSNG